MRTPRKPKRSPLDQDKKMVDQLDELAQFQEFKKTLLPALRADLLKGTPAKDILERVKSLAAARLGQIVATEVDSGKALSAIKDVLDRTEGKAKETVETTHKFSKLKDQELDSLLNSRLKELSDDGAEEEQH